MLNLQLPDGASQFDASVFTQSGEFVMCGHREECELKAKEIGGLYCWHDSRTNKPFIRGDFEHTLCPQCKGNPAQERHPCPYQEEIKGNSDPEHCTCCSGCRQECAEDI